MTPNLKQQLWTLRSFPVGLRNCYQVRVSSGTKYLIRASFMYGDYDGRNTLPGFDLYFGPNLWTTVKFTGINTTEHLEIIHVVSSNRVEVCLVDTGAGTPFISALELRPLPNSIYQTASESLATFFRLDAGSSTNLTYRYKDDVYDRVWNALIQLPAWTSITTTETIDSKDPSSFLPPQPVMSSASTPINASAPMEFNWAPPDDTTKFYVYLYFAEIQKLEPNESRVFDVLLNGKPWSKEPVSLRYLQGMVSYITSPITGGIYDFALVRTPNSTHPPLLSAVEIYRVLDFPQSPTNRQDVDSILDIKGSYGVGKNWEGDPCAPREFIWQGLNCSFVDSQSPTITSLDLSSSGLIGEISKDLANLKMLETLDLSNNSLSGAVPNFLTQLPSLRVLNLERNNLSGVIPSQLIQKSKDGSLFLSYGENPNLINTSSEMKGKSSIVIPVVAAVGGFVLFVFLISGSIFWIKTKQKKQVQHQRHGFKQLGSTKGWYSYDDILKITNNLERVLGIGGFGKVYYGQINGIQVAVKMLSHESLQGYDQFQAEVDLLVRVHHKNLTALVGYCDELTNKGLIYEYMGRGNLASLISSGKSKDLNWKDRLHIAVDSANGLEYLHHGIKPAIIHRDVKSANILLDNDFRAKVSDFGLSKAFPTKSGVTHLTATNVVGTFGYLDPEYYATSQLNEKSDVFGFGVIILEIITGKPALIRAEGNVTHIYNWVNNLVSQGDIRSIIDQEMEQGFDLNSIWKAVDVAMCCVSSKSKDRPNMSQVVVDLKECLAMELARDLNQYHQPQTRVEESISLTGPFAR